MCGCLTALFRLLGPRIWKYSTLRPPEVLDAIERQAREGEEASLGGGGKRRPRGAIQKKALQALPLLVSSASSPSRRYDGLSGGHADGVSYGGSPEAEAQEYVSERERGARRAGGDVADKASLADDVLEFLSHEISALSCSSSAAAAVAAAGGRGHNPQPEPNNGKSSLRRTVLTNTLLDVLEVCYDRQVAADEDVRVNASGHGDHDFDETFRYSKPESWPWNSGTGVDSAGRAEGDIVGGSGTDGYRRRRRQWPLSWPVRSLPRWAPRLADAVAARSHAAGEGGDGEAVSSLINRATGVLELVLHQHAGAAWRKAIWALRGGPGGPELHLDEPGSNTRVGEGKGEEEAEEEDDEEVLMIFRPLLERICLDLPLLDLTARVHAIVFQAHGWLSLLPCGEYNTQIDIYVDETRARSFIHPRLSPHAALVVPMGTICLACYQPARFVFRHKLDASAGLGYRSVPGARVGGSNSPRHTSDRTERSERSERPKPADMSCLAGSVQTQIIQPRRHALQIMQMVWLPRGNMS